MSTVEVLKQTGKWVQGNWPAWLHLACLSGLLMAVSHAQAQEFDPALVGASYIPPIEVKDWALLVGAESQLFVDDFIIHSMTNITRVPHQPVKYEGNPILLSDRPWEGKMLVANGTVIADPETGQYRMYYKTLRRVSKNHPRSPNMVAFSSDGLHWTKPSLGIIEFEGSKENNLVMGELDVETDLSSFILDPLDPDPSRRWKAAVYYYDDKNNARPVKEGLYGFFSSDGLHWTKHPRILMTGIPDDAKNWPVEGVGDVSTVTYDRKLTKFVAWVRVWDMTGGRFFRARGMTTSQDFIHWEQPWSILLPDKLDRPGDQLYGMTGWPYESMWLGTLRIYQSATVGQVDFQLISSRDGIHWARANNRHSFIPNGPEGSWDHGYHTDFSNAPLRIGDQLYFYYASTRYGKAGPPVEHDGGICLARMRVDGFASLQSKGGTLTGVVITRPLDFRGKQLFINAAAAEGEIRVEILDGTQENDMQAVAGFSMVECVPVKSDGVALPVTWKGREDLSLLAGKTVRLKLQLSGPASLYSFAIR